MDVLVYGCLVDDRLIVLLFIVVAVVVVVGVMGGMTLLLGVACYDAQQSDGSVL